MYADKIKKDYLELIKKNPEKYAKDYEVTKEIVKNSTAYYKGHPVPFNYEPLFLDIKDYENLKDINDMINRIGRKVVNEYLNNEEYRKLFNYPDWIEEMILKDPGYDCPFPIARYDVFYNNNEDYKLCEINTDGSSAMNEDAVIGKILKNSKGLTVLSEDYYIERFELFDSWVDEALKIYNEVEPSVEFPNVAIVDVMESATKAEFMRFKLAFEKRGLNCEILDIRELEYRDGALYHGDYKIDLIYRRIVTFELINYKEDCKDFIDAYMDSAMVTVGPIRSQIIHSKIFFKILFDKETKSILEDSENEWIEKHVPKTYILEKDSAEEVINNKDSYIIKPMDRNASTGVYAGLDYDDKKWSEMVNNAAGDNYIYQEYVKPRIIEFIEFDENGEVYTEKFASNIGLFSYNENLAGIYARMGRKNIIEGLDDYITAPAILAVPRSMDDILPRINELAAIAKQRSLTDEEEAERSELREEYLRRFRVGMRKQLLNIMVVDEEGNDITEEKLNKLYKEKNRDI